MIESLSGPQTAEMGRADWQDLFGDGPEAEARREVRVAEAIEFEPRPHVFPQEHSEVL